MKGRKKSRRPPRSGASAAPGATDEAADAGGVFPPEFRTRMEQLLADESAEFFASLADPPAGLRVNTLRLSPERFAAIAPFPVAPLAFPPAGFRVDPEARAGRHPYHAAGVFYLQDPGAMAVAALLDAQPGERVIDLAAAPGGKTTHIAALMQGKGFLVANDVQPARTRELVGNLERCGVGNAIVTLESVERLACAFGAWFDRVLLDAPCSGEAMFHKSAAARSGWSPAAVAGCARRQTGLLADAARLVRPGGRLVYSTCTFSPEEDEEVIARFLYDHRDFEITPLPAAPGASPGRPEWVDGGRGPATLEQTVRLWPHRVPGAGHYVAGLRRTGGEPANLAPRRGQALPPAVRELWDTFRDEFLVHDPSGDGELEVRGQHLYRLPSGTPELGMLRVERPGCWLGSVLKNRLEPAHALALLTSPGDPRTALDLTADDPRTAAFLRGETLPSEGPSGWLAVMVDGFPLGWGKRVGATVKNHFPKGLRW